MAVVTGGDDDVEDVDVAVAVDVAGGIVLGVRWFDAVPAGHADDVEDVHPSVSVDVARDCHK